MPTLTPKPNKLYLGASKVLEPFRRLLRDPVLGNDDDEVAHQMTDSEVCFSCFDAVQGILAVMLVYHSFRAAFFPCQMFGNSAAMVKDITVCADEDTTLLSWGAPLPSPDFCFSVFFMISGIRHAHKLWKAPIDVFRVAVVQRIIHLFMIGGAAILVSALASLVSTHQRVAELTQSLWLRRSDTAQFADFTGLLAQIVLGPLHQSITVNPCLWILYFEMVGSAIVAGLVLLLKASPHKLRSRWLMVLFVSMLVPSVTKTNRIDLHMGYNILAGSEDTVSVTRSVAVDPIQHSHFLQHISEWSNTGNVDPTSTLKLTFEERDTAPWFSKGSRKTVALDKRNQAESNAMLFDELIKASDTNVHSVSTPWVNIATQPKWDTNAPWLFLSCFVAGAWISEAMLSSSFGKAGHGPNNIDRRFLAIPLFALLSASYPETPQVIATGYLWKAMEAVTGLLGLKGENASQFWGVTGSLLLIVSICLFAADLRKVVAAHTYWISWGQGGFSLFLMHTPVLHSLTCGVFLFYHHFFGDDVLWLGPLVLFFYAPFYFGLACLFHKFAFLPSVSVSEQLGRRFLGTMDSFPDQGFSLSNTPSKKQSVDHLPGSPAVNTNHSY